MPMNRTSLFLPDSLRDGLKFLRARDGTPEAESIRRAVADYLGKKRVPGTVSFNPDQATDAKPQGRRRRKKPGLPQLLEE
jgi:hypothetical protein